MTAEKDTLRLAEIRQEYASQELSEAYALPDALEQFRVWLSQAISAKTLEPTAMVLSTASAEGQPSARVVLLKELDHGFIFFTNYQSRKGSELSQNPKAALTFFWPQLERQVRIEGIMEKVSEQESDTYFQSRPVGSQIGATASPQSQEIASRKELENAVSELQKQYEGETKLPRPEHWGGYRLLAHKVEFWQGRPSRLHDRLLYTLMANTWKRVRLAP